MFIHFSAGWLGALSTAVALLVSPVTIAFCRRKSTRVTAVLGGLVTALGCLFTSFASQFHQLFFSYGTVIGIGVGMTRDCSTLMVAQYFKRRREFVEIFIVSGSGLGIAVMSAFIKGAISKIGWRLGLQAVTGVVFLTFILGTFYRSASLYHPQRRAILHLKNQKRKIKDKNKVDDKPPFFDFSTLRSKTVRILLVSTGISSFGINTPIFYLAHQVEEEGLGDTAVLLQTYLGLAWTLGCAAFGLVVVQNSVECRIARQYLCQAAVFMCGLSILALTAVHGNYHGYVLFAWIYGIFCGGYHYSLKMYTYERVRARNFARTWGFVQCSQAIPIAIGVPISVLLSVFELFCQPRWGRYDAMVDKPRRIQETLQNLEKWTEKNGLHINMEKTVQMTFRRGGRPAKEDTLQLNNEPLEIVNQFKYLGIILQTRATSFRHHVQERTTATIKGIYNIENLHLLSQETAMTLFSSAISPIVKYGIELVWEKLSYAYLNKIEQVKACFLKCALRVGLTAPSRLVYELAKETFFVENLRLALPCTIAFDMYIAERTKKRQEIGAEFYATDTMLYRYWTKENQELRHVTTRAAIHGFHHKICATERFHEPRYINVGVGGKAGYYFSSTCVLVGSLALFFIDLHRRNLARHKHTRANGTRHLCVSESCPQRRRLSFSQEPENNDPGGGIPAPPLVAVTPDPAAGPTLPAELLVGAGSLLIAGPGEKPELTCISEEGIADMDLPDNLLDDLDYIGDCITSCNKVENYLMLSEFENNLIAEMPVILDRKGRRWSLARQSTRPMDDASTEGRMDEAETTQAQELRRGSRELPPFRGSNKWRLMSGPKRVITVIDEASV
ncbi:hypothetical protein C0J52_17530 [Blattella germanica]|nr:hypothetical protein C0J52_17530 [Blattella germanica]